MTPQKAIAWLKECQRYFRKKDDGGEEANINAENAGKIAELLEVIAEERAHFKGALEDIIDAWKYQDPDLMREIARKAISRAQCARTYSPTTQRA